LVKYTIAVSFDSTNGCIGLYFNSFNQFIIIQPLRHFA
jgi:hypothetical protein